MPGVSPDLIAVYRATVYRVGGIDFRIDVAAPALDALLTTHDVAQAAFITAYNPFSEPRGNAENVAANARLAADLDAAGFSRMAGEGIDPSGQWQAEASFLVFGLSRPQAIALAKKYGQAGFVFLRRGFPPELALAPFEDLPHPG